jgi:hypothetical protein
MANVCRTSIRARFNPFPQTLSRRFSPCPQKRLRYTEQKERRFTWPKQLTLDKAMDHRQAHCPAASAAAFTCGERRDGALWRGISGRSREIGGQSATCTMWILRSTPKPMPECTRAFGAVSFAEEDIRAFSPNGGSLHGRETDIQPEKPYTVDE